MALSILGAVGLVIAAVIAIGAATESDGHPSAAQSSVASQSPTSQAASSPSPAAQSPTPSPVQRRFETPQALITYLDGVGKRCNRYETVQGATGAVSRGRCYVGSEEVTVGVYAIHSDVEQQWQFQAGLLKGVTPIYMALGENWTINGPEAWTRQVADVMGAEFRSQA